MATITLQYDARNTVFKQLIQLFVTLGGKVYSTDKKNGLDIAMDEVKHGRVHEAKDVNDLMKQILG